MEEIIIDEKDFESPLEVHELLADALDFPQYYGQNLAALWDCLEETDLALNITVIRSNQKKDWLDGFIKVFKRASDQIESVRLVIKHQTPSE